MTGVSDFGDVRSILQHEPSHEAWETLCSILDGFLEDRLEAEILPYCEVLLESWPDDVRVTPETWSRSLLEGAWSERFRLARTLRAECRSASSRARLRGLEGAERLTRALARHGALTRLELRGQGFGVDGIEKIAQARELGKITHLDLRYNQMGDDGFGALVDSPFLGNVKTLRLRRNGIKSSGGTALAGARSLANVEHYGGGFNPLGARAWKALVDTDLLSPSIAFLDLGYNKCGEEVIEAILESGRAATLRCLNLRNCNLRSSYFFELARRIPMPELEFLSLENSVDWRVDYGQLADAADLSKLKYLYAHAYLDQEEAGEASVAAVLGEALPSFREFITYDAEDGFPGNFWARDRTWQ